MSKVFDHLLPAFRTHALLPDEERIGWIRQARWINYSRTDQILGRLEELLDYPTARAYALPAPIWSHRDGQDPPH